MSTTSRNLTVFACMFVLSACGGGSKTTNNPNPVVNAAPVVNAGADAVIRLPVDNVALDGTVTDDGRPAGAVVSTAWTVQSGPAGATFADANAIDTTATFVNEGTYVLQLTADDTALQGNDTVQVIVEAAPALATVAVTPAAVSLLSGGTQAFSASGTDQYGDPITVAVTWSTDDPDGTIDAGGDYTAGTVVGNFIVTATEGAVDGTANVTISSSPPTANAGGPYVGVQGAAIALDGSGSTDTNNDIVSYDWDLDNDGAYDDATGVSPTFAAAGSGVFTIGLQVTDADGASNADSTTVAVSNAAPIADAGPDQPTVSQSDTVTLDGSNSSDPGGDALTYAWTLTSVPVGSAAALNDATAVGPTFDADLAGSYVAQLVVNDGTDDSAADTVTITVGNVAPTADAGPDQPGVTQYATVTLDGSGSSDPGGDTLTYAWTLTSVPGGSAAVLDDATAVSPTFDTDVVGNYVARLVVNDGTDNSAPDTVSVMVIANPAAPTGVSASGDDGQVSLNWADNIEPDLAAAPYRVYRSETQGGPYALLVGPIAASEHIDNTVVNGTTYYYVVTAEDATANVSANSAEVATTPNGPVHAYWTLDEGAGLTTADTVAPDDGSGTIISALWATGVSGSALDFEGVGNYVEIDNTQTLNITGKAISLTAWIYPHNDGTLRGSRRVISKRTDAGGSDVYAMGTNSYRLLFRLDSQDLVSSHIIRLEEWLHVAMVYDGVDKRIYVNGVLDAASPQAKSDPIDASSRPVHLGMRESEGRHFDGVIDEVQIFNRALSAGEVATMHGLVVPPAPEPGLSFTDITVSAGVSDLAEGGHGVMFAEVYGPAGQDSLPDLYLTNRGTGSVAARAEQFYVNQGGWTFDEDAAGYFIDDVDGGSQGAVWADLDNDGDYDLVNGTTWDIGGNPDNNNVFENDGLGSFTEKTPASISTVETKTHGLTAFDMDADGDLDLFSVSGRLDPFVHEAYLNGLIGGGGSFAFTSHVGGSLSTAAAMQGVVDTDYDGDGDIDIMAGNRSGDIAILDNDGTGIFTQISPPSLGIMNEVADGITTADVDNDGDLDLLLVRKGNASLYHRDGGNYVKQQTFTLIEGYMGGFADLDNDGYQDLIFAGDERTFMNDGAGIFVSGQSVPVSELVDPKAIAFADIDSDGDLDFAIAAEGSRNWLVRNDIDLAAGNWLRVELVSPQCQAGAFGAKVSVSRIPGDGGAFVGMREAKGNHGFLAQDEPVLHFGLGAIASVDVVVDFVDGSQTTVPAVDANQRILIDACTP